MVKVSAKEAAEFLDVSRMQISRLVAAGEIKSERFGNALQIDLESLQRYRELRPGRGRPLEPHAAWNVLLERRVPRNLNGLHRLAVEVRRRAERREVRVLPGAVERVLVDPAVVVSGASAAVAQGAAVQDGPPHQVYVRESEIGPLSRRHGMREVASDANVIVRVVPDDAWAFDDRVVPPLVALVDLVDERDDRSAAEALRSFT